MASKFLRTFFRTIYPTWFTQLSDEKSFHRIIIVLLFPSNEGKYNGRENLIKLIFYDETQKAQMLRFYKLLLTEPKISVRENC